MSILLPANLINHILVGMEDARADIGMSGTDDEMSDEDFSFDSGDDRPPS